MDWKEHRLNHLDLPVEVTTSHKRAGAALEVIRPWKRAVAVSPVPTPLSVQGEDTLSPVGFTFAAIQQGPGIDDKSELNRFLSRRP